MPDDEPVVPSTAPPGEEPRPRRRRRAVGPRGAAPAGRGAAGLDLDGRPAALPEDDDERFLREVPPHHGT